jgi:peroxiredoxin
MTLKVGDRVPSCMVGTMTADGPDVKSTDDVFKGKKVALFGLPGAFTKTCSSLHMPGFIYNAEKFREKGVDTIACLSVNDPWVMDAWAKEQKAGDKIDMLADGALNFTRPAGLEVDLNDKCYGPRCKRFSALVDDGVVTHIHFEEGGFGETSAERLLEDL